MLSYPIPTPGGAGAQLKTRLNTISELPDLDGEVTFWDLETTGIEYMTDKPFMLLLGVGHRDFALRWDNDTVEFLNRQLPRVKLLVGYNNKYDMHIAINGGVQESSIYAPPMFDGMLADALIFEHHRTYNMGAVAERWATDLRAIGIEPAKYPIENEIARVLMLKSGPKLKQYLYKMPIDLVVPYGLQDLRLTRGIFKVLSRELIRKSLTRIARIEFDALKVLVKMERRGVPIDWSAQHQAWLSCNDIYGEMDDELTKIVGYRTNVNSMPELHQAFRMLGLQPRESYDKENLGRVDHPVAKQILDMRSLTKIIKTFIDGAKKHAALDGKIHADFNQLRGENEYGVVTGRLSISDPNLQQIPKRNARWAEPVRKMFADPDRDWESADWSQFEYRIFASCTGDEGVIQRYRDDPEVDFHQTVADIAGIPRPKAKSVNLGLVFGMGPGRMAKEMGLPYKEFVDRRSGQIRYQPGAEAEAIFSAYHTRIPGAKRFLDLCDETAKKCGFVTTLYNRRIHFPEGHTHKAGGLVFQGTAADIMKMKLIELDREFERLHPGTELILVVHDEFCCLFPEGDADKVRATTKAVLEDVPELQVPVMTDIGTGRSWWDAGK